MPAPSRLTIPASPTTPAEFSKLNDELFGDGSGVQKVGKGTVYAGQPLSDVFTALQLKPDFDYTKPQNDNRLLFVHRKLTDGDLYFVDNRGDNEATVDATFRVTGKAPELWRAETGTTEPASFNIADGRTTVPLHLEPWGTVFVVFRRSTTEKSHTVPKMTETKLASVEGPWKVAFQSGRGAPPSITMDAAYRVERKQRLRREVLLRRWHLHQVRFRHQPDWFSKGAHLWLDLGDVKNLAEVSVNGKDLGVVWHAPYRVDVTSALKPGNNDVVIKVVNAWVNRLIGDEQPGATKITFADVKPYKAKSPLLPSGLLGPVAVVRSE